MMKISVLINTLNEEKNIRNCLETIKWADEIIVVDMYSDDKTVEIAREYTDKIFLHERMGYADPARQFALDQASNDWILVVDADELVPINLRDCLIKIAESGQYDAVSIPHRNYIFGNAMRGTGWGPLQDRHVRFFKKDFMNYSDRIHNFAHLDQKAKLYNLTDESCSFIHFNMFSVEQYIEKLNRYTTIEALNDFDRKTKFSINKTIYFSLKEFLVRFFLRKGYKDGFQGISLAFLMAMYRLVAGLKLKLMWENNTRNPLDNIELFYQKIADNAKKDYKYDNK